MISQKKIVIGIRNSALSNAQTEEFISLASKNVNALSVDNFEIKHIKTTGDIKNSERLDKIGGKGLFIKEIEEKILSEEVDIGVHSMKDMPSEDHDELEIICYMKRLNASDVLISNSGKTLSNLPSGSVIGTSSMRRRAQIINFRKDVNIKLLRGNVDTRLSKLKDHKYDAIVLAYAGISRLKKESQITEVLDRNIFLPAAGQGVVGIQSKRNTDFKKIFKSINNTEAELVNIAERNFLKIINANCNSPVSVNANVDNNELKIECQIFSHDGDLLHKNILTGVKEDYKDLSDELGKIAISTLGQSTIDNLDEFNNDFNYSAC